MPTTAFGAPPPKKFKPKDEEPEERMPTSADFARAEKMMGGGLLDDPNAAEEDMSQEVGPGHYFPDATSLLAHSVTVCPCVHVYLCACAHSLHPPPWPCTRSLSSLV